LGGRLRDSLLLTTACVTALFACKLSAGGGEAHIEVDCKGTNTTIDCTVRHVEGEARAKACWDLSFACENGEKVTGAGCQVVGPGETTVKSIPITELRNHAACDKVAKSEVLNLKISEP
jgi:hypothetical protein